MKLGGVLKRLREDKGLKQSELAKKLNVSAPTISNYENGQRKPDPEFLLLLADFYGVSVDYILGKTYATNINKYVVPVFASISCGNPLIADENIIDYEELDPKLENQGEFYGLRVRGSSMEPRFQDGDVAIVKKQSDCDNGDIAIVLINGESATMKYIEKSNAGLTLIGTNTLVYKPHFYSKEEVQTLPVQIIGKVIELRAKF